MADTATTASEKTSKNPADSDHILERLEALADQYADQCRPKPWLYSLKDEEEASQILLAMAATIKHTADGVTNKMDRHTYLEVARKYRLAVVQGKALQTFREMTEEDQLELFGLELRASRIVLS